MRRLSAAEWLKTIQDTYFGPSNTLVNMPCTTVWGTFFQLKVENFIQRIMAFSFAAEIKTKSYETHID